MAGSREEKRRRGEAFLLLMFSPLRSFPFSSNMMSFLIVQIQVVQALRDTTRQEVLKHVYVDQGCQTSRAAGDS